MLHSAGREAVSCQARERRTSRCVSSERNNADGRFPPRPKGAPPTRQCRVALLEKGLPFPSECTLPWRVGGALNVTLEA